MIIHEARWSRAPKTEVCHPRSCASLHIAQVVKLRFQNKQQRTADTRWKWWKHMKALMVTLMVTTRKQNHQAYQGRSHPLPRSTFPGQAKILQEAQQRWGCLSNFVRHVGETWRNHCWYAVGTHWLDQFSLVFWWFSMKLSDLTQPFGHVDLHGWIFDNFGVQLFQVLNSLVSQPGTWQVLEPTAETWFSFEPIETATWWNSRKIPGSGVWWNSHTARCWKLSGSLTVLLPEALVSKRKCSFCNTTYIPCHDPKPPPRQYEERIMTNQSQAPQLHHGKNSRQIFVGGCRRVFGDGSPPMLTSIEAAGCCRNRKAAQSGKAKRCDLRTKNLTADPSWINVHESRVRSPEQRAQEDNDEGPSHRDQTKGCMAGSPCAHHVLSLCSPCLPVWRCVKTFLVFIIFTSRTVLVMWELDWTVSGCWSRNSGIFNWWQHLLRPKCHLGWWHLITICIHILSCITQDYSMW